jgi:ABC-type uncharacterized transport system, permease component
MQIIPIINLGLVLIPAGLVVYLLWQWSGDVKGSITALARMIIQLVLVGYVLTFIFASKHALLVMAVLSVMLLVSSWMALGPVSEKRKQLYWRALVAIVVVNVGLLALITQGVLISTPWFAPNLMIPLAGMIFATGMNTISLFAERFYAELEHNIGLEKARNIAYSATMIPTINSLLAVGLVSLPGMMTGQILSGVSPLIAVRYQIMIMLMLFVSSGLTAPLFYYLIRKKS